jgi:hypothetical protein
VALLKRRVACARGGTREEKSATKDGIRRGAEWSPNKPFSRSRDIGLKDAHYAREEAKEISRRRGATAASDERRKAVRAGIGTSLSVSVI